MVFIHSMINIVQTQMGNSESKVDTIKSNAKEYKIIFVLGGPGSGKGTQVRFSNAAKHFLIFFL